jgi:hypothetical protein
MNYEEILTDFEALKQEILDFKSQMTVDDFYFYELEGRQLYWNSNRFKQQANELCKKHFKTNYWDALKDVLEKQYLKAAKKESVDECLRINRLCQFLFGIEFSYEKKYDFKYKAVGEPDWKGRQSVEEIPVWKGRFHTQQKELTVDDCLNKLLEITKPTKQNILLKNWRSVLLSLIDQPWKAFNGRFDSNGYIQVFREHEDPKTLSTADYTCFLALKNALRSDLCITTHEQEILMQVSSGIAIKIAIRKTGNYAVEAIHSEKQIYSMTDFAWEKEKDYNYTNKTVLHISGYTNSEVNLQIPNGYYFVDENYAVQLEFIAAPILLNSGILPLMATADHASVDLLDDEEEERKRREEEDDY